MIKETITLNEAISYLNELIKIDKSAMAALSANRVPCNQNLADHPTVQVGVQNGGFHVGLIGIINGMFGADENQHGPIAFAFENGDLDRVVRTRTLPVGSYAHIG